MQQTKTNAAEETAENTNHTPTPNSEFLTRMEGEARAGFKPGENALDCLLMLGVADVVMEDGKEKQQTLEGVVGKATNLIQLVVHAMDRNDSVKNIISAAVEYRKFRDSSNPLSALFGKEGTGGLMELFNMISRNKKQKAGDTKKED